MRIFDNSLLDGVSTWGHATVVKDHPWGRVTLGLILMENAYNFFSCVRTHGSILPLTVYGRVILMENAYIRFCTHLRTPLPPPPVRTY